MKRVHFQPPATLEGTKNHGGISSGEGMPQAPELTPNLRHILPFTIDWDILRKPIG